MESWPVQCPVVWFLVVCGHVLGPGSGTPRFWHDVIREGSILHTGNFTGVTLIYSQISGLKYDCIRQTPLHKHTHTPTVFLRCVLGGEEVAVNYLRKFRGSTLASLLPSPPHT